MASVVRQAETGDLTAVEVFDPFLGDRAREIAEARMLVAEVESELAGYVSWQPKGFIGRDFIAYLCVLDRYRRQHIARALICRAVAIIGPGRVYISTESGNTAMLTLLERSGWVAPAPSRASTRAGRRKCSSIGMCDGLGVAGPIGMRRAATTAHIVAIGMRNRVLAEVDPRGLS